MKELKADVGRFQIMERDDYTLTLTRKNEGADEEMALYGVLVSSAFRSEKVFVLADSEEAAASQALCACGANKYNLPDEVIAQVKTHVERLPLVIRGWSGNRF